MNIYIPNKKLRKKQNQSKIFLISLSWFLLVFIFGGFFKLLTTKALAITQPVQQKANFITQFLSDFWNFYKIRNDYYRLKEKEGDFTKYHGTMSILKFENEKLHKILNSESHKFDIIPSKVLIGDLNGIDGVFIINRGSNDGLKIGMNVILPENVLVGKIIEIASSYSKVVSIYNSSINLSIINVDKGYSALLKKENSGLLTLKFYPENSQFDINDVFITSNENKDFIQGLLVGKIKNIRPTSISNQKNIIIEPFFELPRLQNVFVISNYP